MNRIKLAAKEFYDSRLGPAIDAELNKIFTEIPEQITLSWIIEKVVSDAKEDEDEGDEITLIIEDIGRNWRWNEPGDSIMLYIDKKHEKSKHECDIKIHLSRNKKTEKYDILSIECRNKKPGESLCIGRIYNLVS